MNNNVREKKHLSPEQTIYFITIAITKALWRGSAAAQHSRAHNNNYKSNNNKI